MAIKTQIVRKYLTQQMHRLDSLLATTDFDYEEALASYEGQKMRIEEQLQVLAQGGLRALEAIQELESEEA